MVEPLPELFSDRIAIEQRSDVLVYTSAPLTRDLEVAGAIKAVLSVSSSAPDTDFVVVLHEVDQAGRAIGVTHGITRMRYREGMGSPAMMRPGQTYSIDVDLWFANIRFARGNRLRLHVSSAFFPFFDRNLNTGASNYTTSETRVAINSVHHAPTRPSRLILPARGTSFAI